jgi:rhodanese-related sulfurtransferase
MNDIVELAMISIATYFPGRSSIMTKQVTRSELQARIAANPDLVLLEALPQKYYDDWHLPGARHMPHDQVSSLAPTLAPDKRAEVIVYCASETCRNSHIAADQLIRLGYTNVAVYAGGKKDWTEAGLPVETGKAEVN